MHRKLAVAFRDPFLYKVFEIALMANKELQGRGAAAERRLREQVCLPGLLAAFISAYMPYCTIRCKWRRPFYPS